MEGKNNKQKFYISTPIYYVNDSPHVGSAYTTIAADIMARYYRLKGYDVFFLTGTDEHEQKLEDAANNAGMEPKQFADKVVKTFKDMWKELNISNDGFIRTTDEKHVEFCKYIYQKMKENGDIYKGEYNGLYCVGCEKYIKEIELEEGNCPLHKKPPQMIKEESYFFRLSNYQQKLLDFYKENPKFIAPEFRKQEVMNRVEEGLNDLSISRTSITWGIQVPGDPTHVMYVWIDALSNYISALGYPSEMFDKFWPANVHLIGKDIWWFHMVIWPAMLMSAGFKLPEQVFAHGFWTVDGSKMSKSLGNVIRPGDMKKKYGLDAFRYYLFSKAQFGQDNDFSERQLVEVLNTELADDLGNLLNRIIVLTQKYFKGKIPIPREILEEESRFKEEFNNDFSEILSNYENFNYSKVLKSIWEKLRYMNKYITEKEPWTLHKQNKEIELMQVMFNLLESMRLLAILLQPFLPDSCKEILDTFDLKARDFSVLEWRSEGGFKEGQELKEKKLILFTKKEFIETEKEKPKKTVRSMKTPKIKETIEFQDFLKLDMRSAKITSVETFKDSKKLLILEVECGGEKRTIVAGIGKQYTPQELTGKNIIIVVNLAPKKIHGVESQGMVLAVDIDNEPTLLVPDKDVQTGFPVR